MQMGNGSIPDGWGALMNESMITVKELKEILNQFPDDLPVLTHGFEAHFDPILYPSNLRVKYNYENEDFYGMYEVCAGNEESGVDALVFIRNGRMI